MTEYNRLIEALLYIQGEAGVTPKDIKVVTDMPTFNARKLLQSFMKTFNAANHGIMVVEFKDVFKWSTRDEFKEDITKVVATRAKQRLSNAAIEAVGIIAYKQPITKSQINLVRGVASEAVVNTLLVKGLIEEKGIAKTPGNPILYGITPKFYDYFRIKSLKELPELSEFDESEGVEEGFELFSSQREQGGKNKPTNQNDISAQIDQTDQGEISEKTDQIDQGEISAQDVHEVQNDQDQSNDQIDQNDSGEEVDDNEQES